MEEPNSCPNCNEKIKEGWITNSLFSKNETEFINFMMGKSAGGYCNKCGKELKKESQIKLKSRIDKLEQYLKKNIKNIPILTTHTPFGWEYESYGIVTGQSVTGTGFVSEFKSDFSDFFGGQSGSFNKKLSSGEVLCFRQLRAKALKKNANAIIATDIDYGEAGASKGMLMVCAAGTAVNVKNTDVFGSKKNIIEEIQSASKELESVARFRDFLSY